MDPEELEAVARAIDEAMRWGPRSDHDWAKLWRARDYEGTHGHYLRIIAVVAVRTMKSGSASRPVEQPSEKGLFSYGGIVQRRPLQPFWVFATEVSEDEFELWFPSGKVMRVVPARADEA